MARKTVSQWLDEKAKKFRDALDKLKDSLPDMGQGNELQPIPIRVDEPGRRRR